MMPLILLPLGTKAIVDSIRGNDDLRRKLLDIGIVPGIELEIYSHTPNNPLVIKLNENRIMIDMSTSQRIMVR